MSCKHDCPTPPLFPKLIFNRPALSRIDYRIGNYADVRAHLLDQLNKQAVLSNWTHRGADDPGIAILESDAVVADILTFYQTLYANETYLRTAQWPQSITDLVRLGGYRLAPGVAGEATFALTIKGKLAVTVPMGFGLKAQLEGIDKPVEFESRAAIDAIPALSQFKLYRPRTTPAISNGTSVLRVSSLDVTLKADDRLLLGEPVGSTSHPSRLANTQIVIVDEVWDSFGYRYIRLKTPVIRSSSIVSLRAYKLGETLRHFGHNAPPTVITFEDNAPKSRLTSFFRRTNWPTSSEVTPNLTSRELPLDREFKDIAVGNTVLIQGRFSNTKTSSPQRFTLVRTVDLLENESVTWGMQSGAASMLTLNASLRVIKNGITFRYADIRSMSILQVTAEPFTVRGAHVNTNASSGQTLKYFGHRDQAEKLKGRRLLMVPTEGDTFEAHVDAVTLSSNNIDDSFHSIALNRIVTYSDFEYDVSTIDVFGNIVDASQGKTLDRLAIGSGDARSLFQSFALPKAPLTYLFDAARTPAQTPALDVYVDDILWKRLDTLFNAGPKCQVYIVREDSEGNSVVQFGDGKTGARLPTGRSNIVAGYRVGIGAHGVLKQGSKPQATGKLDGLDKVFLPVDVTTGADPESADNARLAAPAKLQSLGRLVSLADYEAETRMLPNVLKANARWAAPEGTPLIALTVLTQSGSSADLAQIRDALTAYSRCRGPARHPVLAINGHKQFVHVDAMIGYDPSRLVEDITKAIKLSLGLSGEEANGIDGKDGLFGLNRRDFHQSVHSSEIIAAIQNVPGVAWVKLRAARALPPGSPPQTDPNLIPLPAINLIPSPLLACSAHFLLALHTRHLVLGFVSAQAQAECPT
ncbi:MAG: hypothetical protein ACREPB_12560 [Arenimonas sp.]